MNKPARTQIDRLVFQACQWMARHLWIIDKEGQLIPLVPNSEQRVIMWWYFAQRLAGVPVRIIVLKARKVGVSTIIEALGFMDLHMHPNRRGLIAAHDEKASGVIFRMTQIFYEQCPNKKPIKSEHPTKKEIRWKAPHRSLFDVQTAGSFTLGRSDTLHFFHGSEVPYWVNAEATLLSVLNALGDKAGNVAFLEATASGVEEFCSRWRKAVSYRQRHPKSLRGWIPLFFSVLAHKPYQTALVAGETVEAADEHEEAWVVAGATPEQLKWRRAMLEDKCNGDVQMLQQEYPATPDEAFRATGSNPITAEIIAFHEKMSEPGERLVLDRDEWNRVRVTPWQGVGPYWEVWERPSEFRDYAVGGDVAEGTLSEPADPRSERDYSAAFVLNRVTMEQAAEWWGRIDGDEFGDQMVMAAEWYGWAWGTPESQGAGQPALLAFKRAKYPNLYRAEKPDDKVEGGVVTTYGWRTQRNNRHTLIISWIMYCRRGAENMPGNTHRIMVRSEKLAAEESTFYVNKMGKAEHRPGCHDDILFAAMIALQVHLRCPRQRRNPFQGEQRQAQQTGIPSHAWAGGRDAGLATTPGAPAQTG